MRNKGYLSRSPNLVGIYDTTRLYTKPAFG